MKKNNIIQFPQGRTAGRSAISFQPLSKEDATSPEKISLWNDDWLLPGYWRNVAHANCMADEVLPQLSIASRLFFALDDKEAGVAFGVDLVNRMGLAIDGAHIIHESQLRKRIFEEKPVHGVTYQLLRVVDKYFFCCLVFTGTNEEEMRRFAEALIDRYRDSLPYLDHRDCFIDAKRGKAYVILGFFKKIPWEERYKRAQRKVRSYRA